MAAPTGTDITGLALKAPGLVQGTFGAGANSPLRYLVFCNETAIGDWTDGGADHVATVPAGQTTFLLGHYTPAGAQFHDATYAFGVKGENADGLDANTTELTLAVTPQGVGTAAITSTTTISGNVPVLGVSGGEAITLANVTVADVVKWLGGTAFNVDDVVKFFGSAARVPVAGEVGGEKIDVEAGDGIPVQGIKNGEPIDEKMSSAPKLVLDKINEVKKVNVKPVDVNSKLDLGGIVTAITRLADAVTDASKLGGRE